MSKLQARNRLTSAHINLHTPALGITLPLSLQAIVSQKLSHSPPCFFVKECSQHSVENTASPHFKM